MIQIQVGKSLRRYQYEICKKALLQFNNSIEALCDEMKIDVNFVKELFGEFENDNERIVAVESVDKEAGENNKRTVKRVKKVKLKENDKQ